MKYSVLMSIYSKENPDYFRSSIKSMLNQTVACDELVIVKDGPLTKELDEVIEEFKDEPSVKIVALSENKGLGPALNIGISHCSHELIARMDTDDISLPDRCERQLQMFLHNDNLAIVSSSVMEFDEHPDQVIAIKKLPTSHREIINYAKKRNPFNHPAVMYKKSVVDDVGGYKPFRFFEDYYLWVRMILKGAVCANIEEPLLYMRANQDMFKRRGGWDYLKCLVRFKSHLKRIGFYSSIDVVFIMGHGFIALLPNRLRIWVYRNFLRG